MFIRVARILHKEIRCHHLCACEVSFAHAPAERVKYILYSQFLIYRGGTYIHMGWDSQYSGSPILARQIPFA